MISPCIQICIIDDKSGLCQGCGRTIDEIATWASLSDAARIDLIPLLKRRLEDSRIARKAAAGRNNPRRQRLRGT